MPAHSYLTGFRETEMELERRVVAFLEQRQVAPLDEVRVSVRGGTVVLRGTVRSRSEKLLVAECCRRVAGVANVIDVLHVSPCLTTVNLPIPAFQPV